MLGVEKPVKFIEKRIYIVYHLHLGWKDCNFAVDKLLYDHELKEYL